MRKIPMTPEQFTELCRVYNAARERAQDAAKDGRTMEAAEMAGWAMVAGLFINLAVTDAQSKLD